VEWVEEALAVEEEWVVVVLEGGQSTESSSLGCRLQQAGRI